MGLLYVLLGECYWVWRKFRLVKIEKSSLTTGFFLSICGKNKKANRTDKNVVLNDLLSEPYTFESKLNYIKLSNDERVQSTNFKVQ